MEFQAASDPPTLYGVQSGGGELCKWLDDDIL
jgi:hypothetical protein